MTDTTRETILRAFTEVATEQGKTLVPLTDKVNMMETGLDSLCIAIIVARLEDELDQDPFSGEGDMVMPVTVGDFIKIYESAMA